MTAHCRSIGCITYINTCFFFPLSPHRFSFMRLAEALIFRADLQKSIDDIKNRIVNNAVIQEGTQPAEDPATLMEELYVKLDQHEKLVYDINFTNIVVKTENGLTLNDAIQKRDTLSKLQNALTSLSSHVNSNSNASRYSRTEILSVATVDIPSIQKRIEDLTQERRLIEVQIQATNWTNTLISRDE